MQANVESLGGVGMHETNRKVSAQNIEIPKITWTFPNLGNKLT
jgi:hypothetical protein